MWDTLQIGWHLWNMLGTYMFEEKKKHKLNACLLYGKLVNSITGRQIGMPATWVDSHRTFNSFHSECPVFPTCHTALCLLNIISSSQKFLIVFPTLVTDNFLRKCEQTISSFLRFLKSFMISGNSTWHDPWCQHRIWPNAALQFSVTAFEAIAVKQESFNANFLLC